MDRQAPGIQTSSLNMGNTQTFDELFRAYHAPLCYFATTFVNSDEDAQDLVEDMFLKMWQKAQHFENIQHAQAFLYRSARNACLNYLKHGKRAGLKYEILTAEAEQFEEDYLVRMIRSEVWGEIYRAIENLPTQCSKVITMSFIDEKSNEEIAEELDLSIQTVKNHKVRALHILRDTLPNPLFLLLFINSHL